ncbi:MAG: site-2 protease family protein [Candidatus Micrarchaeota archaeon]|nr:site-2 protease family protein [Candidatus Micrarchaeota archaeon]
MNNVSKTAVAIALAALTVVTLWFIAVANFGGPLEKFGMGILDIFVIGLLLQVSLKPKGGYGLYLVGTKRGIKTVDNISKRHAKFWDAMAMWGLTVGLGLISYPLVKGRIDRRVYAFGMASLVLMYIFLVPYLSSAYYLINIPQLQNAIASQAGAPQPTQISALAIAEICITLVFGFTGLLISTMFVNAGVILVGLAQYLGSVAAGAANSSSISNQVPGVAPVIPGIDIPLITGLVSLVIILVIHEFSHGILARSFRIKLKSIGVLLFGTLPIGAFVEPDEKAVNKLDSLKQTKIYSAGVSANFIAAIAFFFLSLLVAYTLAPSAYKDILVITTVAQGYPASGVLQPGMQILSWNGHNITNVTALNAVAAADVPGQAVTVATSTGTFTLTAVQQPGNPSHGIIGIDAGYKRIITTAYGSVVNFFSELFLLSMLLNFLVAVLNLLPLPIFDGWRIYKANVKNKMIVKVATALVILGFVLNAVPWIFYR